MVDYAPLTDDTRMPYGRYKGYSMSQVPASYFHYLWTHGKREINPGEDPVADYVRARLTALKAEFKDGIWE